MLDIMNCYHLIKKVISGNGAYMYIVGRGNVMVRYHVIKSYLCWQWLACKSNDQSTHQATPGILIHFISTME